jgi:hypothetical protein
MNLLGNYNSSTYVYARQGGCVLLLEKVPAKGIRSRQDKISVVTFLEGFCGLVSQFSPPIQFRTDHSA